MKRVARVVLAGARAREFLASPGEARAIGVFRRSMYLENARGRIACLAEAGVGPGPLNALCEFPGGDPDFEKRAAPGSRATVGDGLVRLEPDLIIDASRPAEWAPPPLPDDWSRGRLRRNLALLAEWTGKRGAREGLAPLVPRIAAGGTFAPASVFEEMAREGADAFGDWLSDALNGEETPAFCFADHPLIGLGPGLTPSGDDFWCGTMIALRALGRPDVLEKVAGGVLSRAAERTNRISRAHLACAAAGQGAGALHEAISAMGTADGARLRSALRALDRVGGASGRDSLAGVACVFARAASPSARRASA